MVRILSLHPSDPGSSPGGRMFGVPRQYPVVVHVRVCACDDADVHVYDSSHAPVDDHAFACAISCIHGSAQQKPGSILRGVLFLGIPPSPEALARINTARVLCAGF